MAFIRARVSRGRYDCVCTIYTMSGVSVRFLPGEHILMLLEDEEESMVQVDPIACSYVA